MNYNIAQTMTDTARRYPDSTGLVVKAGAGYRSWTFGEMNDTIDGYCRALVGLGVSRGERVILMVKPSLEFICLTFALFKLGAVIILIDPGMGYRNLRRCIAQVKPAIFIGIPKAHIFRMLFPAPFKTVRLNICVGRSFGVLGRSLRTPPAIDKADFAPVVAVRDELAAILFTTGSTGPPKGVCYSHGVFQAQLELIGDYYAIGADDIDQPAFPLFALFSAALGACAVIPDMEPARPARLDPARFVKSILDHKVTYSFGSPAIWNVVSNYCLKQGIKLGSLAKVLMAGAPVSGELIGRVKSIIAADGEIHIPYGATESLPITSMSGSEILAETWALTRQGKGTCVGRPLPAIDVRVVGISEKPIPAWDEALSLPTNRIGEIVVRGPVVTRAYDNNDEGNKLAKIADGDTFWHRLGDVGYFDDLGRLWFCGRKAHRVVTANGTLFSICCEAIFNEHPAVYRSALVGLGTSGRQRPVLIVELAQKDIPVATLLSELRDLAAANILTRAIEDFLVHPAFPVDIRHNAKIFREKLAVWAAERLRGEDS